MAKKRKRCVFFTSQSGLEIKQILRRINQIAKAKAEVLPAEDEGIGDHVRTSSISKLILDNIENQYQRNLARMKSSKASNLMVSLHSCFWQQGAFFTTIDRFTKRIPTSVEPAGVITLIDDFYSVYFRIRRYYAEHSIKDLLNPFDLLYWRATDIALAGVLANQLGVDHFVVSLNHSVSLLENILTKNHTTVYAGHPITDIRNLAKTRPDEAEGLVKRINDEFLFPLSAEGRLATFIPDTIDEAPMLEHKRTFKDLRATIWPKTWLKGSPPIGEPVKDEVADGYINELCNSVRENVELYRGVIMGQISDRDYRLAMQAKNFAFVLLKQAPSSNGVASEFTQAKWNYNNTYFFNPDGITKDGGQGAPNWANRATGESSDLKELIETICKSGTESGPLLNPVS